MIGEGGVLDDREARGNGVTLGGSKGKLQTCPGGIRKVMHLKALLKCLYTNACSVENK